MSCQGANPLQREDDVEGAAKELPRERRRLTSIGNERNLLLGVAQDPFREGRKTSLPGACNRLKFEQPTTLDSIRCRRSR